MATEILKHLFTVDDYHRMVDAGILGEDDRVELIRGEVIAMSPIGPPHNGTVFQANNLLVPLVGRWAIVGVQAAIRLDRFSEPQPDIVLLRPKEDFYTSRHPGPEDVLLIIEIADSSLEYDRNVKARLYAETGIAEYWIADLANDCVWVYSDIYDNDYRSVRQSHREESVTPQLLPECSIPTAFVLAPRR